MSQTTLVTTARVGGVVSLNRLLLSQPEAVEVQESSEGKSFYLCGFPILHSASPSFHNFILGFRDGGHYSCHSTSKVTQKMLAMLRSDSCGGSSVTMPLKTAIIPYLDGITSESRATGAVNTIVKVPNPETKEIQLIGTNTDFLGVRNALLRSLRQQHPIVQITPSQRYAPGTGSAMVIGGGATTRSAVYALHTLGLSPIFLVNRCSKEVEAVIDGFPQLKGSLIHLDSVDKAESYLSPSADGSKPKSPGLLMIVGAIPAITPKLPAERLVYTIVSSILTIPYTRPESSTPILSSISQPLPLPTTRLFLDMAYKPRLTPMLRIAGALGWYPIDGIQAMIEQGLAQERMWKAGDASVDVGSDPEGLGLEVDLAARRMVENMKDIVVKEGEEVDLAFGEE